MIVTERIQNIDRQIAQLVTIKQGLIAIQPKLAELPFTEAGYDDRIDFDYLTHTNVIEVIKHFGGKWTKTLVEGDTTINYVRDERVEGLQIRCYCGAPPPNCRIIEEEVEIPEEVVSARTEKRRRLVCID